MTLSIAIRLVGIAALGLGACSKKDEKESGSGDGTASTSGSDSSCRQWRLQGTVPAGRDFSYMTRAATTAKGLDNVAWIATRREPDDKETPIAKKGWAKNFPEIAVTKNPQGEVVSDDTLYTLSATVTDGCRAREATECRQWRLQGKVPAGTKMTRMTRAAKDAKGLDNVEWIATDREPDDKTTPVAPKGWGKNFPQIVVTQNPIGDTVSDETEYMLTLTVTDGC